MAEPLGPGDGVSDEPPDPLVGSPDPLVDEPDPPVEPPDVPPVEPPDEPVRVAGADEDAAGFALDFVGEGDVVEPDGVADGEEDVSASTADAPPTVSTTPVPILMTSGFRTDRASTAYNLPNASPVTLPMGA